MESNHSVTDSVLSKHELEPLYETLIIPHLTQTSQPVWDFDIWFAQLDNWNRGIIHASQLKEYLIGFNYTNWGEISRLIPGVAVEKVTKSTKLNEVFIHEPGATPTIPEA